MSDLSGGEAGSNLIFQFLQNAADNSISVLVRILDQIDNINKL